MFDHKVTTGSKVMLLAGILAGGTLVSETLAQSPATPADTPAGRAAQPSQARAARRSESQLFPKRALLYYQNVWGIDSLTVRWTEAGEIIRFSYRVLDRQKAAPLSDKQAEPSLIDLQAGVKLVVPSLPFVGQMRQSVTTEAGKSYWVTFSNKGGLVKRGHRVSVVIGQFHADGLVVD